MSGFSYVTQTSLKQRIKAECQEFGQTIQKTPCSATKCASFKLSQFFPGRNCLSLRKTRRLPNEQGTALPFPAATHPPEGNKMLLRCKTVYGFITAKVLGRSGVVCHLTGTRKPQPLGSGAGGHRSPQHPKVSPDVHKTLKSLDDINLALSLFSDQHCHDESSYKDAICELAKASNVAGVVEHFEAMKRQGLNPDMKTCLTVCEVLGRAGRMEEASQVHKTMKEQLIDKYLQDPAFRQQS